MSEPSGRKMKTSKELKKKKPKTESSSSLKSPKALIKKLNIGKVYKGKKKDEESNKQTQESDMTVSQETLCSMEDELPPEKSKEEEKPKVEETEVEPEKLKDEGKQVIEETITTFEYIQTADDEEKNNKIPEKTDEVEDISEPVTELEKPEEDTQNTTEDFTDPPPSLEENETEATGSLKKECLYKILVIGELGTGKTSIIKRYVHQFFSQHYRATIGVDFALKVINWDPNTIIRLQLWDIAGQERFGNMTRVYYKEAVGAFIVFDVTRAATFEAVVKWKQDLDAKVQLADGSPIPCVLLANKCDQQKEGLVNNNTKMEEYSKDHKFTGWFETSAKENINIEEAARMLVEMILKNDLTNDNGRIASKDSSKFPLDGHADNSTDRRGCNC